MKLKLLLLAILSSAVLLAQNQTVSQFFYDSSSNQRYICIAPLNLPYSTVGPSSISIPVAPSISIAAGSLTNIVVSGAGVATVTVPSTSSWNGGTYAELRIVVSGSTTSALNGLYTVTSSNTTTTTFTFNTTAAANTYTDVGLTISTNNPILTQNAWNLVVFSYDTSNRTTGAVTVNSGYGLACSGRSNY